MRLDASRYLYREEPRACLIDALVGLLWRRRGLKQLSGTGVPALWIGENALARVNSAYDRSA